MKLYAKHEVDKEQNRKKVSNTFKKTHVKTTDVVCYCLEDFCVENWKFVKWCVASIFSRFVERIHKTQMKIHKSTIYETRKFLIAINSPFFPL